MTRHFPLYLVLLAILGANMGFWLFSHELRPAWGNVPPVTSVAGAKTMTLGDAQLAYRAFGLMLQNLGETGGKSTQFALYDYSRLKDWFLLEDKLDPLSNYVPALAAYYYGATLKKEQITPVVDYLEMVGQRPEKNKWRWLAHAVYLARYQQGDLNRALDLANRLATLPRDDMPMWAIHMPAYVLNARGDKEAAYAVMMGILSSSGKELPPNEVLVIRDYICNQILTPAQAALEELCVRGK